MSRSARVVSLSLARMKRELKQAIEEGPIWWVLDPETKEVRPTRDTAEWAHCQANYHHIAIDMVGDIGVSTIFTGTDMSIIPVCFPGSQVRPMVFETMAFDAEGAILAQCRYTTWDAALAGHDEAVAELIAEHGGEPRRVLRRS